MWRYLSAAFLAAPEVPGLGRIPVNVVAMVGIGILGFAHPAFWLAGIGLEFAYLFSLVSSPRFRKMVDTEDLVVVAADAERQRAELEAKLATDDRSRVANLAAKCQKVLEAQGGDDPVLVGDSVRALDRLRWLHLKLLFARHRLNQQASTEHPGEIERTLAECDRQVADPATPENVRTSQRATAEVLRRRLEVKARRAEILAEIASDLTRLEAQVDLALDEALISHRPAVVAVDVNVGGVLDGDLWGGSAGTVDALDRAYAPAPVKAAAASI